MKGKHRLLGPCLPAGSTSNDPCTRNKTVFTLNLVGTHLSTRSHTCFISRLDRASGRILRRNVYLKLKTTTLTSGSVRLISLIGNLLCGSGTISNRTTTVAIKLVLRSDNGSRITRRLLSCTRRARRRGSVHKVTITLSLVFANRHRETSTLVRALLRSASPVLHCNTV